MDPLTAIGLASNILSFLDFGAEVVSTAIEIYGSSSGSTEENRSIKATLTELRHFAFKLQSKHNAQLIGEEKSLCMLANECDDIAKQIIALIEKVEPKGQKSKTASLRAAVKSKWYEHDRRKLEERLGGCRAQLELQLNYLTSSEVASRVDSLIKSVKDDASRLEQVSNQVDHLRRGVTVSSLSPESQDQLRSLLLIPEHADNLIVQLRILENLSFDGMYQRHEDIPEAHSKTLRWIFDNESKFERRASNDNGSDGGASSKASGDTEAEAGPRGTSDEVDDADESRSFPSNVPSPEVEIDQSKAAAKEALLTWLSSGNGIFHISGKLGSGKSTLMKFLCEHESTLTMLKQWANPRDLIFASFFFWKPGSNLQKSLIGLLRSLLHDVLQASPQLIPDVLPDYWRQVKSTPWQAMSGIRLSDRDIRTAFSRVVSDTKLYKDHCFCFFIDGLDEYEGTPQDDAKSLVDLLCSWTTIAPNNVKLCVSSREYNVFMSAFPANKRIRLHEVTRSDMRLYVSSKLEHLDEEKDKEDLMDAIIDNAEGIFLWLALVVRKIREQVENGRTLKSLRREIGTLPKEMDALFVHLLDTLPDSDLREAYQTFSMVMELSGSEALDLSLMSYSFLDDYNQNQSFALEPGFAHVQLKPSDLGARTELALKRLNGCCKGIVESVYRDATWEQRGRIPESQYSYPMINHVIKFTHRSVPEFLSTGAQKDLMQRHLSGFDAIDTMSHLVLAQLLADPQLVNRRPELLAVLVHLRDQNKLDKEQYLFLDTFSSALIKSRKLVPKSRESADRYATVSGVEKFGGEWHLVRRTIAFCADVHRLHSSAANAPGDPIYNAAFLRNLSYVRWRLTHDLTALSHLSMEVILYCMIRSRTESGLKDVLDAVGFLITLGLTPQTNTGISFHDVYTFEKETPLERMSVEMTVWQHLLLTCYNCAMVYNQHVYLPRLGFILQTFLEHGADPYFRFSVSNDVDGQHGPEESDAEESDADESDADESDAEERDHRHGGVLRLVVGRENRVVMLNYSHHLKRDSCNAASLAEFVRWFKFENEESILQLIEKNTKIFDEAAKDETVALEQGHSESSIVVLKNVESPKLQAEDAEKPESEELLEKRVSIGVVAKSEHSASPSSASKFIAPVFVLTFGVIILAMIVQLIRTAATTV